MTKNSMGFRRSFITNCAYVAIIAALIYIIVKYAVPLLMPFILAFLQNMNSIGDANIEDVLNDYIEFYNDRIKRGLPVDRASCPYNSETLKDRKLIKSSMLTNPFEKYERKRFLYHSKDL